MYSHILPGYGRDTIFRHTLPLLSQIFQFTAPKLYKHCLAQFHMPYITVIKSTSKQSTLYYRIRSFTVIIKVSAVENNKINSDNFIRHHNVSPADRKFSPQITRNFIAKHYCHYNPSSRLQSLYFWQYGKLWSFVNYRLSKACCNTYVSAYSWMR